MKNILNYDDIREILEPILIVLKLTDNIESKFISFDKHGLILYIAKYNSEYWKELFLFEFKNISGKQLNFGSPTTEGRPDAGYGGLFWRGPQEFIGGSVLDSAGRNDCDVIMGKPAHWLAYTGTHTDTLQKSTLIFLDNPDNPRYPNQWFVRSKRFPMVSFAFSFDKIYLLSDQNSFSLRYRLLIADGEPSLEQINSVSKDYTSIEQAQLSESRY
jgi:hypothetical protein